MRASTKQNLDVAPLERGQPKASAPALKQLKISGLLDGPDPMEAIIGLQGDFLGGKPIAERKALGQYFTGAAVSGYMASLLRKPQGKTVRLLDAGAGTGILTASAALRCLSLGCRSVHAVLYEIDAEALAHLEKSLKSIQSAFKQEGGCFTFKVRCEDFVLARPDKDPQIKKFDLSVINPPYFKYSAKGSPYAKAAADLYPGDPNIYASFMAIALSSLKEGGQLVSITPRSFTNGLYFKGFRSYLLSASALDLIHIFKHRDKVFNNSDAAVLQENIICRFVKGFQTDEVKVRASDCDARIQHASEETYPVNLIVDPSNDQRIIRIPESSYEAEILKQAEALSNTFSDSGYFISTGRVVEHRTRAFVTGDTEADNSIPLYRPHNITPPTATWTGHHKKDASFVLNSGHKKHTMPNGTFVLLKRCSSKDEKRRLVASVHLESAHRCPLIGFGNKTNYVGVAGEKLPETEAYGLAAIFNSSFMDKYFRCISGNTQVNATEIRVMKFPTREQVRAVGLKFRKLPTTDGAAIDAMLNPILGIGKRG